ncbi:MAG: hypothetical protein M1823_003569 [Watsoniomyces obsoletus]|nr:MAG: hypothetical protein M1823_003569 [Watsoniomyces obsoletus]
MPSKKMVPFLVVMMLVTGVCNTLLTKYQDMQCVRNCDSSNPKRRKHFEQPVIQTAQMFVGEMGCWLVVAAFGLYNRYVARRRASHAQYQPVRTDTGSIFSNDEDLDEVNRPESQDGDVTATKVVTASQELRRPLRGWRIVLLALPACCDIAGTTLMNVGLLFVAASIYQMTRGALVLFVGLFSVLFLHRRLRLDQWAALVLVVFGVGLVGLAGALFKDHRAVPSAGETVKHGLSLLRRELHATARSPEAIRTTIGILLIAGAQIFTASQFVLEEWTLERYALDPLKVVGWEGIFGFLVTTLGMIVMYYAVGRTDAGRYGYFDTREGWRELTQYRSIGVSSVLIMISIGGFNYFGLSVTRTVSATSRSTIDTCRTLFIWIVSLGLGWETFKWLQVFGFALLVYGTFLFNDIVTLPLKSCRRRRTTPSAPLLPEEPIEHM